MSEISKLRPPMKLPTVKGVPVVKHPSQLHSPHKQPSREKFEKLPTLPHLKTNLSKKSDQSISQFTIKASETHRSDVSFASNQQINMVKRNNASKPEMRYHNLQQQQQHNQMPTYEKSLTLASKASSNMTNLTKQTSNSKLVQEYNEIQKLMTTQRNPSNVTEVRGIKLTGLVEPKMRVMRENEMNKGGKNVKIVHKAHVGPANIKQTNEKQSNVFHLLRGDQRRIIAFYHRFNENEYQSNSIQSHANVEQQTPQNKTNDINKNRKQSAIKHKVYI